MKKANPLSVIKQLVIIGVGLIGGSFALDLKRAKRVNKIIGVDRSKSNLLRAQQLGVIDAFMPLKAAVNHADVILVAAPVGQMADIFAALADTAKPDAIITDVGSTKADVAVLYQQYLMERLAYCLPAHPVAGAEQSGAAAARYGLYQQRKVVLCPFSHTAENTIKTVQSLWQACGAHAYFLDVEIHDQILASVSHLPHLVAFSYMHMLGEKSNVNACLNLASTGFRDFSRIAGSNPEMWRDIALANRNALLEEIQHYQQALESLYQALDQRNEQALFDFLEKAQLTRQGWESKQNL
jgi:prephenate dehydrogenase